MAYKTFANGFPLPASDLNNFLMNQSVIVFADAAARTTAIPSPVTGMLTYLEDTNAYESWNGSAFVSISNPGDITAVTAGTGLTGGGTSGDVTLNVDTAAVIPSSTVTTAQDLIVADGASSVTRLGVGADDQVLSVVSGAVAWADASGGGGMTLLASGTAGDTAVTLSSIPQTYRDLRLILLSTSTNKEIYFDDNNSATDYTFKFMAASTTAFTSITYAYFQNSSGVVILDWKEYTTSSRHSGNAYVINSNNSDFKTGLFFTPGSGAISTITFEIVTGGSATYELYGVK